MHIHIHLFSCYTWRLDFYSFLVLNESRVELIMSQTNSFWKSSPGPHWLDYLWSFIPFFKPRSGVLDRNIVNRERNITLPDDCYSIVLNADKSKDIEELLRNNYKMFEKSRIILRAERIKMGLLMDEWIGVGVMCASREKLIGCCF